MAKILVVYGTAYGQTERTIFIFRPLAVGESFLMYGWALAAALWVVLGAVAVANGGHLSRRGLRPQAA